MNASILVTNLSLLPFIFFMAIPSQLGVTGVTPCVKVLWHMALC